MRGAAYTMLALMSAGRASGMAFVDTLLQHSPERVSVLLVDKRARPGGHWNDACTRPRSPSQPFD